VAAAAVGMRRNQTKSKGGSDAVAVQCSNYAGYCALSPRCALQVVSSTVDYCRVANEARQQGNGMVYPAAACKCFACWQSLGEESRIETLKRI
jgi:hypothetical protein